MSARTEVKMEKFNDIFDMSIDPETQDLKIENSYDTDIACSLLTDKRATQSQIAESSKRRGWIGDLASDLTNYEIGSWIWLLSQERLTNSIVNKAVSYGRDCLQWILDLDLATRIQVTGARVGTKQLNINISIYVQRDLVSQFTIPLWENSIYA